MFGVSLRLAAEGSRLLRRDQSPGACQLRLRIEEVLPGQAILGALPGSELHPALVNGGAGVVVTVKGRAYAVLGFTVAEVKILEIDAIADPKRVQRIAEAVLSEN